MTDVDLIKRLRQLGVYDPRWKKDAYTYFSHSGGRTHMGRVSEFFKEAVALAESAADALERKAR